MHHLLLLRRTDYTHVIFLGSNELNRVVQAITRYSLAPALGLANYQDPVAFDMVFEVRSASFRFLTWWRSCALLASGWC